MTKILTKPPKSNRSTQPDSFRLQKINEIAETLNKEVTHYRLVAKKHKRAKTVLHYIAVSAGVISGILSCASIGALFTGIGITVSIPLAGVSAAFGA